VIEGRKGGNDTMANIITGAIAVAMGVVYYLYYAIRIKSIPLWIIIIGAVSMLLYDFYESVKGNNNPPGM
jgi:RsiW-degrading membrane proteinase PrsW (M82 family)